MIARRKHNQSIRCAKFLILSLKILQLSIDSDIKRKKGEKPDSFGVFSRREV